MQHLSLKSWQYICLLKSVGGLGIRLFSKMNKTLVSKLAWKMIIDLDSLWVRVLHGEYVKGRDFLGDRG